MIRIFSGADPAGNFFGVIPARNGVTLIEYDASPLSSIFYNKSGKYLYATINMLY